jgi:hypothetical protein
MASGWGRAMAALGAEILLWGSIVFAVAVRSFYGLLLLPLGMFTLSALVNRFFPLVPVDADWARARRRAVWIFGTAIALAVLLVLVRAIR